MPVKFRHAKNIHVCTSAYEAEEELLSRYPHASDGAMHALVHAGEALCGCELSARGLSSGKRRCAALP